MPPTARELLAEAVAAGEDLETVARAVLERLAQLTGLSSTYLAETRLKEDEQLILFSYNSSQIFHIPEGVTLPWSEAVCRFVVEGAPNYSKNVPKAFPRGSVSGAHRPAAGHLVADPRADVAIVGLGAMGALTAWRLAARGARVIGFERFRPGHDQGSAHGDTRIFRTAYFESPEYVPLLQRAHGLWRDLEHESGAELLTLTGGLAIGPPDGELVAGVLNSARQSRLPHRLLDPGEMNRLYPQHRLEAGDVAVLDEQAGFLRPELSVAAAVGRAEAVGARLMTETEVTAIIAADGRVVVETSRGRFAAERALVAAGAWTSKLLPQLGLRLADRPARGHGPQRLLRTRL